MSDARNDYEVVYEDGKPVAVRLLLGSRKYPNRWAIVDWDDWPRVKKYRWFVHSGGWYAASKTAPGYFLHRFITRTPEGMDVHHVDGNGLNNRRANLEVLTRSEHTRQTYANGEIDRKTLRKGIRKAWADPDNYMGSEEHRKAIGKSARRAWTNGTNRGTCALTDDQVLEARRLHATGDWTYAQLAERFKVAHKTIYSAVTGRTYRWVPRVASSTPRQLVQREARDG